MKISRAHYHNLTRWRVTWRSAGRTKRRFFKNHAAAKKYAKGIQDERRQHGEEWSSLTAQDKAQVLDCLKMAHAKGYTLPEACRFYEANGPVSASTLTLSELVKKFMAAKRAKKLRSESLRVLEITMEQFMENRETQPIALIRSDDIQTFLDAQTSWGLWRRRGAIIDLGNLFRWSVKADLLVRNPVASIERPTIDHEPPEVLSVEQAKRLLNLCREKHSKLLPWLVISLFAGLRAAEVERMQMDQVGQSMIDLRASQAKGRARRLITIRPALSAWLAICDKKGPVCEPNHRDLALELRKDFGGLPRNVLRHSFISYALGAGESIKDVAMESGNSEEIIFRHYREIVTQEAAKAFWELSP